MPALPVPLSRTRIRRTAPLLTLAVVALGAGFVYSLLPPWPGKIEELDIKVRFLPLEFVVWNGQIISLRPSIQATESPGRTPGQELSVFSVPITGGTERVLYRLPNAPLQTHLQKTAGGVLLVTQTLEEAAAPHTRLDDGIWDGLSEPYMLPLPTDRSPGFRSFRMPPRPPVFPSGSKQTPSHSSFSYTAPRPLIARTRRIPLTGPGRAQESVVSLALPKEIQPKLPGVQYAAPAVTPSVALTDSALFWSTRKDNDTLSVTQPSEQTTRNFTRFFFHQLSTPDEELYSQSRSGATVRDVAAITRGESRPHPNGRGIMYTQPREYPDTAHDLTILADWDAAPVVIPDYRSAFANGQRVNFPLLLRQRLWWLQMGKSTLDNPNPGVRLVSVREDGSDRQEAFLLVRSEDVTHVRLDTDGVHLYLLTCRLNEKDRSFTGFKISVLHPESSAPLGPRIPLPGGTITDSHVENGWLYYYGGEYYRSPLDFLSPQVWMIRTMRLCRVRLPE